MELFIKVINSQEGFFNEDKDDIFSFPAITLLVPNMTDVRYKNQNGIFVLYPEPWKEKFEFIYAKYIIPVQYKQNILSKLEKNRNHKIIYNAFFG